MKHKPGCCSNEQHTRGRLGKKLLKGHAKELTQILCQNIKISRAEMNCEDFEHYFENLGKVLTDIHLKI